MGPFQTLAAFFDALRVSSEHAHAAVADDDASAAIDAVEATAMPDTGPTIKTVGAWAGMESLKNPTRDMLFAKATGINRIDIIVNDHSAWRSEQPFTMRDPAAIIRLARAAQKQCIEVHLMSWLMPHRAYIEGAANALIPLMRETGATSLCWDAEEPWMLARRRNRMRYDDAGALVGELFGGHPFAMGATGIRYASTRKLRGLARACDYLVPQCYSTNTSKADPSTVVSKGVHGWAKKFDRPTADIVPGLAAYRQTKIKGHTVASAMLAAIDNADDFGETVIYWGLNSIRRNARVARAVRMIGADKQVPF